MYSQANLPSLMQGQPTAWRAFHPRLGKQVAVSQYIGSIASNLSSYGSETKSGARPCIPNPWPLAPSCTQINRDKRGSDLETSILSGEPIDLRHLLQNTPQTLGQSVMPPDLLSRNPTLYHGWYMRNPNQLVVTAACMLYKEPSGKVHRTGCSLTGYYRPTKTAGNNIDWISHEYDPPKFPHEWSKFMIESFQRSSIERKQWICDEFRLSRFDMVLASLQTEVFEARRDFFLDACLQNLTESERTFFLG